MPNHIDIQFPNPHDTANGPAVQEQNHFCSSTLLLTLLPRQIQHDLVPRYIRFPGIEVQESFLKGPWSEPMAKESVDRVVEDAEQGERR